MARCLPRRVGRRFTAGEEAVLEVDLGFGGVGGQDPVLGGSAHAPVCPGGGAGPVV
ncbi:MAG TPA: hypothetical protein VHI11_10600 [Jiangellaceae bacterium]|nr:hypothetical protein [Jiangellaceae bacterium]